MLYYYKKTNTLVELEIDSTNREITIWSEKIKSTAEFFMLKDMGELEFIGYV